jgi:STE24 endopeptidase
MLLLTLLILPAVLFAQQPAPHPYSLPPDKLQRAIEYAHARYWLHFIDEIYGMAALLVLLAAGVPAKIRDWAERASSRRVAQAAIFVPLAVLAVDVLSVPISIYSQRLELKFDQSIQSWPSWLWDWTKMELLTVAIATLLVFILYGVIRRSPRRWWFYFWLASLPLLLAGVFVEPFVIEPLFYSFEPLAARHPGLAAQLDRLMAHGGLSIPRDRMFEMKASEKLNSLNAYVTGFGASKRVVIWDTTLARLSEPEILSVFGHEMGHYVLGHVWKTLVFLAALALVALLLGFHLLNRMLRGWGASWHIRGAADWASLPVMLLIAALFTFLTEPVINGYSRWQEHQADIYGIEVLHGVVPNAASEAAHAFQVLGEESLDEPDPNQFIEFWIYSHPSISERMAFIQSYNPWTSGLQKYVK